MLKTRLVKIGIVLFLTVNLSSTNKSSFPAPPGTKKITNNCFIDIKLISYFDYNECLQYVKNIDKDTSLYNFLVPKDTMITFNGEILWNNKKYADYPIVGISKNQIEKYCAWRSRVVNIFKENPNKRCSSPNYWSKYDKCDPNLNYVVKYYIPSMEELSFTSIKKEPYHYNEIAQNGIKNGQRKLGISDTNVNVFRCAAMFEKKWLY